ncbi:MULTISPECIES: hypothetical protein [unclassified Acidisoma]|uniref:hypothetical protein n=1 Tax=unclassified Acidisoma TaxID=2634065 RepID=UPI00131A99CC|nr:MULTISPECIES: hypothetical protein [unclassified Acidisoma]
MSVEGFVATPVRSSESAEAALVRAMIAASPYRRFLRDIEQDVVRVALQNDQIHAILTRVAAQGRIPSGRWFSLRRPSADESILLSFLEYLAFASPSFLASVGEWPLGVRRG